MGKRINPDHARARDSFEVEVEGNQVCARRLFTSQGWGMNLKIACVEAAEFPPANIKIDIGKSSSNRKCVDAPSPVACSAEAGNMGKRVNSDHARAQDSFEVVIEGQQVCARRLESTQGWGMNLQIVCPAADEFPPLPPKRSPVLIGKSSSNRKCVKVPVEVSCDTDAADKGNRINPDHAGAGDSFDVDVAADVVCVRRTDSGQGWGMQLKISCVQVEGAEEEKGDDGDYYEYYYY